MKALNGMITLAVVTLITVNISSWVLLRDRDPEHRMLCSADKCPCRKKSKDDKSTCDKNQFCFKLNGEPQCSDKTVPEALKDGVTCTGSLCACGKSLERVNPLFFNSDFEYYAGTHCLKNEVCHVLKGGVHRCAVSTAKANNKCSADSCLYKITVGDQEFTEVCTKDQTLFLVDNHWSCGHNSIVHGALCELDTCACGLELFKDTYPYGNKPVVKHQICFGYAREQFVTGYTKVITPGQKCDAKGCKCSGEGGNVALNTLICNQGQTCFVATGKWLICVNQESKIANNTRCDDPLECVCPLDAKDDTRIRVPKDFTCWTGEKKDSLVYARIIKDGEICDIKREFGCRCTDEPDGNYAFCKTNQVCMMTGKGATATFECINQFSGRGLCDRDKKLCGCASKEFMTRRCSKGEFCIETSPHPRCFEAEEQIERGQQCNKDIGCVCLASKAHLADMKVRNDDKTISQEWSPAQKANMAYCEKGEYCIMSFQDKVMTCATYGKDPIKKIGEMSTDDFICQEDGKPLEALGCPQDSHCKLVEKVGLTCLADKDIKRIEHSQYCDKKDGCYCKNKKGTSKKCNENEQCVTEEPVKPANGKKYTTFAEAHTPIEPKCIPITVKTGQMCSDTDKNCYCHGDSTVPMDVLKSEVNQDLLNNLKSKTRHYIGVLCPSGQRYCSANLNGPACAYQVKKGTDIEVTDYAGFACIGIEASVKSVKTCPYKHKCNFDGVEVRCLAPENMALVLTHEQLCVGFPEKACVCKNGKGDKQKYCLSGQTCSVELTEENVEALENLAIPSYKETIAAAEMVCLNPRSPIAYFCPNKIYCYCGTWAKRTVKNDEYCNIGPWYFKNSLEKEKDKSIKTSPLDFDAMFAKMYLKHTLEFEAVKRVSRELKDIGQLEATERLATTSLGRVKALNSI